MQELLGLDTRGNFKDGPMQDVHWPESLFGYFPCYSLGAMYAAQWFAAMRRAMPDLDARIAARRLGAGVRLAARQHLAAGVSRWTTDELARSRQRRGAEPGALQGAPRGALPRLSGFFSHVSRRHAGEAVTDSSRSFSTSSSRCSARADRVPRQAPLPPDQPA